jgi:hypothetical protein
VLHNSVLSTSENQQKFPPHLLQVSWPQAMTNMKKLLSPSGFTM